MTLVFEVADSKLVEVFTVADVDAERRVDNILVQIWKLKFGCLKPQQVLSRHLHTPGPH